MAALPDLSLLRHAAPGSLALQRRKIRWERNLTCCLALLTGIVVSYFVGSWFGLGVLLLAVAAVGLVWAGSYRLLCNDKILERVVMDEQEEKIRALADLLICDGCCCYLYGKKALFTRTRTAFFNPHFPVGDFVTLSEEEYNRIRPKLKCAIFKVVAKMD